MNTTTMNNIKVRIASKSVGVPLEDVKHVYKEFPYAYVVVGRTNAIGAQILSGTKTSSKGHYFMPGDYDYCEMTDEKNEIPKRMNKLSAIARRILSKENRTLYKAGFITEDLQLTATGKDAVFAILFDNLKEELVGEAKALIKSKKEDEEDEE